MDFVNVMYFNFFSVGSLIPVLLLLLASFFLLSIKNRSKASLHLGIAFFYLTLFNFAYIISGSVYHPFAAYHRWLTVGVILLGETHFNIFLFYYPEERRPFLARVFLVVHYAVAIAAASLFFIKTWSAEKVFRFDGHYWDFSADKISTIIGLIIILYILIFAGLMIWRIIVSKGKDRWIVLAIGISYLLATVVPSVTNTLSRDGAIDRELFQLTWDLFNIVGFFFMLILFINNTKDRTSFNVKLIGITLVTFLLVFQFMSYYSLQDRDGAYNETHRQVVARTVESGYRAADFSYLTAFSMRENRFEFPKNITAGVDFESLKYEFMNTAVLMRLIALPGDNFRKNAGSIISGSHKEFSGYRLGLMEYLGSSQLEGNDLKQGLVAYLESVRRTIYFRGNKIRQLPEKNFRQSLEKTLAKAKGSFVPYSNAIKEHLAASSAEGADLRREILSYLAPVNEAGVRLYRSGTNGSDHYVSFMKADMASGKIYEAGFNYRDYRQFIHPSALKVIVMLGILLVFIRFGFLFFFANILINPLRSLSRGMREVNRGNLAATVPVVVEDEIGFITRTFNKMVYSIRESKEKLQEYAETLEDKVEKRTEELKAAMEEMEAMNEQLIMARDALWGEMELAKKIQMKLLPENPVIADYEISAFMEPADEVGGDYYDIINVAGFDWVVIGDVSGHGVPAGLIMMMTQTAIHIALDQNPDISPDNLLDIVNRTISKNIKRLGEDKYMTITVLAASKGGQFIFSGLHQDIMVYRAATGNVDVIETRGAWIGVVDDLRGMVEVDGFKMEKGDVMILYSDGITEARKKESIDGIETEQFGDKRLLHFFRNHAMLPADEIKVSMLRELEGYRCADDVTMVILKRLA